MRAALVAAGDITTPPTGRRISLKLLGKFSVQIEGREIALATRKARALTGYLALSDSAHDARDRLVGLLWSESDEERARASLRQAVHDMRTAFDDADFDGFRADKQMLALASDCFTCDVQDVLAAVAEGRIDTRLLDTQRITDTLLAGLEDIDPAFHVWVLARRQLLHDRLTFALEQLLTAEDRTSDKGAIALALLNLDPTHEVACRYLIRSRAARGDIGGAMRAYKSLWDLLQEDYDVEPSKETQDLIVGLRQVAGPGVSVEVEPPPTTPAATATANEAPARKRLFISICNFDVNGVSEDKRHLVNGFRHEFVACLARFREWSVRTLPLVWEAEPRTWSSPPEYLVEGSAYESGGAVRLIVTFRDATTSICIWSERYSISLPGWFDTQQQMVRQIATSLNVHVSAERLRRLAAESDITFEIHDRWLRGQALLHQVTPTDLKAASMLVEGLIRDAPDFSPAMSGMVQINNMEHIVYPGCFRDPAKQDKTLQIAQRAVHLDPLDSRAQLSLAWSYLLVGRAHEATLHAGLATDLNENDSWTLMSAGQIFSYCGEYDRAELLAAASLDITRSPSRSQMTYLSAIKFLCHRYEDSVEAARRGFEDSPGFLGWMCAALGQLRKADEARISLDRAFEQIAKDWQADTKPTRENMTRWMLHMFPIAVQDDWERLRAGLAIAGAPVEGTAFGRW